MTNNMVQPKRGPGRPKKYLTVEEKKNANKECVKSCMLKNAFYCEACDRMYHMASKSKHIKTRKHFKNLNL